MSRLTGRFGQVANDVVPPITLTKRYDMTTRFFFAALALALVLPLNAQAQDGEPTMGVSHWKCNFGYIGDLVEQTREEGLPIAQEMVDDGSLFGWGMLTHAWGDEWNVVFYMHTPDGMSFTDAAEELGNRQDEAFGEESGARFLENCSGHKDNVYTWEMRTELAAN